MHSLITGDVTSDGRPLPLPAGHLEDEKWKAHTFVTPSIGYASQYSGYVVVPGLPAARIKLVLQLLQKHGIVQCSAVGRCATLRCGALLFALKLLFVMAVLMGSRCGRCAAVSSAQRDAERRVQ